MAHLIRSAKNGSDWTVNDLDSYRITLNQQDPRQFFGVPPLPQPTVDQELLNIADASAMQQDRHAELITLLDLAMIPNRGESAVNDFLVELFKITGYVRRERVARTRVDLPLFICGESKHAKADVCLVDCSRNDIMLVVQEDKRLENWEPVNARAQLVAGLIAAFNESNAHREAAGIPPISGDIMPGIVMVGTSPTFFKIHINQDLSTHIRHGTYPPEETVVFYCYPPVPRPAHLRSEGMKPLDNRREILKCFEGFKAYVGF